MARPRTVGKIVLAALIVASVLFSIRYIFKSPDSARAVTYAVLALTFAVCYRYFED